MVGLAALDKLIPDLAAPGHLIWPVHPANADIDVELISGTNLNNSGDPAVFMVQIGAELLIIAE